MNTLTNPTQFTTYTPEQFAEVNTVCNISSTGFAEYCPRECPRVFMDYVNDQRDTLNGEFDNWFSIYNGLCNISENVPKRAVVNSFMYDTETYQRVSNGGLCPVGYTKAGVQACQPAQEVTPLPVILPTEKVIEQPTVIEQPPLIRSGGIDVIGIAITLISCILVISALFQSLTSIK